MREQHGRGALTVIAAIVSAAVVFGLGWPAARRIVGPGPLAIVAAPAAGGVTISILVTVSVFARLPIAFVIVGALAVAGVALLVPTRTTHVDDDSTAPWRTRRLLIFLAAATPFLITLRLAPSGYDANAIWWFFAGRIADGGSAAASALRADRFFYAHTISPPLDTGMVATVWTVLREQSFRAAQFTTALETLAAVGAFASAIWWTARPLGSRFATGAGVLAVALVYGVAGVVADAPGTNGYVDVLWGAWFAAGVLLLMGTRPDEVATRFGVLTLAAASVVKIEGLLAVALVAVLASVRLSRRREERVTLPLLALVPGVLWFVVARVVGAPNGGYDPGRLVDLAKLDPAITHRVGPTFGDLLYQCWPYLLAAVLVTALGLAVARRTRIDLLGDDGQWVGAAWLVVIAVVAQAFIVSDLDIHEHLASAVDRVSITGNLLLVGYVFSWAVVALTALRGSLAPEPERATRSVE